MRPYVVVNVAMSADGKISTRERRQVKISGTLDFSRVDQLKAGSDAVMVGIGTVLADDPSLTVKSEECRTDRLNRGADEHPLRIVVDSKARIPLEAAILHKGAGKRIVAVSRQADPKKIAALQSCANVIIVGDNEVDLTSLMDKLGEMGIRRLMVEGGGNLIAGLISAGLVNEIYTFIGNMIIGGKNSPTFVDGDGFILESGFCRLHLLDMLRIESGVLLHWNVENPEKKK